MNVLDLAMNNGLQPKHVSPTKGGEFACACPKCGGQDRFRIWPEQNSGTGSFWCRQCGIHGDRIQFVIEAKGVTYPEACKITGDAMPDRPRRANGYKSTPVLAPVSKPAAVYRPKEKEAASGSVDADIWSDHALKLVAWAEKRLPGSDGETLLRSKGIGMDTARKFRLGWLPEDVYRERAAWGLPEIMSEKTGKPKRLWLPSGLVIPHVSGLGGVSDNRVLVDRIRVRRPEGDPRYYRIPGPESLQLVAGTRGQFAMIVESELDAILMDQIAGDFMSIIAVGTSRAKPDSGVVNVLSEAKAILVSLDNDDAGQSAFSWWQSNYQYAVWHPVPAGKDPSEAYQRKIDLHAWVMSGLPKGMLWAMNQAARKPKKQATESVEMESRKFFHTDQDEPAAPVGLDPHEKAAVSPSDDAPGPISELYGLMRKNRGITITVSDTRLALSAPVDWRRRNETAFNRISRLMYFDSSVFRFLHEHGASQITANNLLEEMR